MRSRSISETIDKLTNSIEIVATGKSVPTEFYRLGIKDVPQVNQFNWDFNWEDEIRSKTNEVYKLCIKGNPEIIHGLIALRKEMGIVVIDLVESAKFNRGKNKLYNGVAGNLFAFGCFFSKKAGFYGIIAFTAKTALIQHYINILGAKVIYGNRMRIEPAEAEILISKYFNL